MTAHPREEVEAAFRNYVMTGLVNEDWIGWSQLFTDDATYNDHFYGIFTGPKEIQMFLESTMSTGSQVYSVLVWYNIDGDQIVYKVLNRADNPEPGGPPIEFPSLQIIQYAGNGKWKSEEDWWIMAEMKAFAQKYAAAAAKFDPEHRHKLTRDDWGPWVDWARPDHAGPAKPSWLGRDDVPVVRSIKDMTFGVRHG